MFLRFLTLLKNLDHLLDSHFSQFMKSPEFNDSFDSNIVKLRQNNMEKRQILSNNVKKAI
jgi:hypothetical protein